MTNLNDTLPELMRRATENLEPESVDLVERGMARGVTLRRRRTALVSFSGAAAVLATAGIIVSGSQLFAKNAEPPAAGTPTKQSATTTTTTAAKPVTAKDSLDTLVKLLPSRLKVTKPEIQDDGWGHVVQVLVNDGKGLSMLSLTVGPPGVDGSCFDPLPGTCLPRPDGSKILIHQDEPALQRGNNPGGVVFNEARVIRRGTEAIGLMNYNAAMEKGSSKTRSKPALTVAELTAIADSTLWRFPPKPVVESGPDKPNPKDPGAGKPAVPVGQTLQTLKQVLPKGLQLSQPSTSGGGTEGFNNASVLVNDGKGVSRVEVHVAYSEPVTKCASERATNSCQVRADGSVAGWTKNAPEYGDARQAKEGVLANTVTLNYKDGRSISVTSYNAPAQKGIKHTRVKPALSTDQMLAMAGNKAWKFPGTGK